jgi:hypothetical protein
MKLLDDLTIPRKIVLTLGTMLATILEARRRRPGLLARPAA